MKLLRSSCFVSLFALAGCGSKTLDVGGNGTDGGPTGGPICSAACGTPGGEVETFSAARDVYEALARRWQICPGEHTLPGEPDVAGVEFGPYSLEPTPTGSTVGGKMFYLVQGSAGLERGAGLEYQLTYDVSPSSPDFQLNMHPTPNSGFGGSVLYARCPEVLSLPLTVPPGARVTLVAAP